MITCSDEVNSNMDTPTHILRISGEYLSTGCEQPRGISTILRNYLHIDSDDVGDDGGNDVYLFYYTNLTYLLHKSCNH